MIDAGSQPGPSSRAGRKASQSIFERRWFGWLDLTCAGLAGALWYASRGELAWLPLLVGLLPWGIRAAAVRFPFQRTVFDLPLLLFLGTAGVGVWAAYDANAAWAKFWLLVGAIILFYAFAGQPIGNLWPVTGLLGFFGALVGFYFLLTHDWQALPAKIEQVNRMALRWMEMRPGLLESTHQLHPNVAGGLMAMLAPLLIAFGIHTARKRWAVTALSLAAIAVLLTGLLFSSSRGGWLALGAGLSVWLLWQMSRRLARLLYLSRRQVVLLGLLIIAGLLLSVVLLFPGGPAALLDQLPGPATAGSRLELSRGTTALIGDFPFTGGGLGSFPGLYSEYVRVIPYFFLIHAHNLFLDVGLEQGLPGLVLLLVLIGVSFWLLTSKRAVHRLRQAGLLRGALLAALTVMVVHGLVEDPLYGSRAVLLLFVIGGLAAAVERSERQGDRFTASDRRVAIGAAGTVAVLLFLGAIFYWRPLQAAWWANQGALEMARLELTGFPRERYAEVIDFATATPALERTLTLNGQNRTAWHRLGLIAMNARNYEEATKSLGEAQLLDPSHPGIAKTLAYSRLWSGDVTQAVVYLATLPEAHDELLAYRQWWREQQEPALAALAEQALAEIDAAQAAQGR